MQVSSFELYSAEERRSISRQKSGERESPTKKLIRFKQEKEAARRLTGGHEAQRDRYGGANSKLSSIDEKENTDSPKREGGVDASRESLGACENLPQNQSMH